MKTILLGAQLLAGLIKKVPSWAWMNIQIIRGTLYHRFNFLSQVQWYLNLAFWYSINQKRHSQESLSGASQGPLAQYLLCYKPNNSGRYFVCGWRVFIIEVNS